MNNIIEPIEKACICLLWCLIILGYAWAICSSIDRITERKLAKNKPKGIIVKDSEEFLKEVRSGGKKTLLINGNVCIDDEYRAISPPNIAIDITKIPRKYLGQTSFSTVAGDD